MTVIRLLMVGTIYSVILLEVYSGVIGGPWWWIAPGVIVIALVGGLFVFGEQVAPVLGEDGGGGVSAPPSVGRWFVVFLFAGLMAGFANYFGREMLLEMAPAEKLRDALALRGE